MGNISDILVGLSGDNQNKYLSQTLVYDGINTTEIS